MDNAFWHQRFVLQSLWTKPLRNHLYKKLNLHAHSKILELGSGTGALLCENLAISPFTFGIDFDHARTIFAKQNFPDALLTTANAYHLPFPAGSFDLSFCHYLLLWIDNPVDVLKEMRRVTRPGGTVIAFAEPDYHARIDTPQIFQEIAVLQNESLQNQGVRLDTGRRLMQYFIHAGFGDVSMGMLSGEWNSKQTTEFELEWEIIAHDLQKVLPTEKVNELKLKAFESYARGGAISFIPTFYAWASVE